MKNVQYVRKCHFEAAHYLKEDCGGIEPVHGHSFTVTIGWDKKENSKNHEIELDYNVQKLLKLLDHSNLNKVPGLDSFSPSAEKIAEYVYKNLKSSCKHLNITFVEVEEEYGFKALYIGD